MFFLFNVEMERYTIKKLLFSANTNHVVSGDTEIEWSDIRILASVEQMKFRNHNQKIQTYRQSQ